jgi:hypothetical protein
MSRSRILVVLVTVVAGLGGLFAVGVFLIADEQGAPIPYTYHGEDCWRAGDLLTCPRPGPTDDVFVAVGRSWAPPRDCWHISPTLVRCRRPYVLEIDIGGDYARLRPLDAE